MNAQANALLQAGFNAMRAGRVEEAIRSLQQAAGMDPGNYDTFAYLGAAYARQGNYESARRAFGKAVQIQPQSARARFNLGTAHQMAGDEDAARVCFEAALAIDPAYAQATDALAKLPPKLVNVLDLAKPSGKMHLPGAQAAEYGDEEPVHATSMTAEEIARLSAPPGHLHMMGAQATEDD